MCHADTRMGRLRARYSEQPVTHRDSECCDYLWVGQGSLLVVRQELRGPYDVEAPVMWERALVMQKDGLVRTPPRDAGDPMMRRPL